MVDRPDRWLLVQRADADPEDVDRVDALAERLGPAATVRRTHEPTDLDDAIADLDDRGLVVCGGDGSIHVAANRLVALDRLDVAVALFPAGTGNDLAHTLELPTDVDAMVEVLTGGTVRSLDLLELGAGGSHGVAVNAVHAGIGVDAAERSQDLPDRLGALAYPLGAMLAGVRAAGFTGEVRVDGEVLQPEVHDETLMVLVLNGRTIGGGHVFAPDADPGDGHLDVLVCHATGVAARAAFGVAVTRGTHLDRDDVAHARGRDVEINGPDLTYNVDGELWVDEPIEHLTIRVRPAALAMLVPHG